MSIENEPLRLRPHRIEDHGGGQWTIVLADGRTVEVPEAFRVFLQLAIGGASLSALAQAVRGSGPRFQAVSRFLIFLNEQGLLADERAVQLAEALSPDYIWRGSLAFDDLASLELVKLQGYSGGRPARMSLVILFMAFAIYASPKVLESYGETPQALGGWTFFITLIFTFALARSARALAQFALFWAAGARGALKFKLDIAGPALAVTDASRVSVDMPYVAGSFLALSFLALPVAGLWHFSGDPWLLTLTSLVFLSELSPFRRSALTECLRALYVLLDRQREDDEEAEPESKLRSLHWVASAIWSAGLAFFIAFPARYLALAMRDGFEGSGRLWSIASAAITLIILISFFDDILSGIGFGGARDTRSIRSLWRRRRVQQQAVEIDRAIEQGHAPSIAELSQLPLLRQMDPQVRASLLSRAEIVEYEAGEEICAQNDVDRTLYIVLSGRIAVEKRTRSGHRKILAWLAPGAVFGEVAFFLGDRRTADVSAVDHARLLAIRHDERISKLDRTRSEELQFRIRFLQSLVSSALFKELPADALDALVFSGQRKAFRAGEKVFSEGESGDACYFILQGEASVVQNFTAINRIKAGDAFGEISLLKPGLLRTATVQADSELITMRVDGDAFWKLLVSHLPLAMELEVMAERRLRRDAERLPSDRN